MPDAGREDIRECVCNVAVPLRNLIAFLSLLSSLIHLTTHHAKHGRDRRESVSFLISLYMLADARLDLQANR